MSKNQSRQKPRSDRAGGPPTVPASRRGASTFAIGGRWVLVALAMIYAIGVWARFEDYPQWKQNRAQFFYQDEPILANGDGYYYLRFANDLAEGTYGAVDVKRRVPDEPPRPSPPPLLSVVTNALHHVLRTSLDRVAVFLPVLLAPLLILPLYLLARAGGGGPVMGLSAALLAVVSEYYVGRTRVGVFDTDCLIVTLTLTVCYCTYRFARETSPRRYLFAAAALAAYGVFYLWWDTATMVVSAICLSMLAIAMLFFYRPTRREGAVFALAATAVLAGVLAWRGLGAPLSLLRGITGMLAFVGGGEVAGPFPTTVGNIRELQVFPFAQMARMVSGHVLVFILGAAGLVWWLLRLRRFALLLAVPVLLSALPMMFGNRFLIFQAPVIALGVGYLLERGWSYRTRWVGLRLLVPVLALVPAAICYSQATARLYRSPMAQSMKAMAVVSSSTPDNATVWSSFWHGYPILYYTGRAVITDAGTLEGPRLVYQNIPLATSDPRLAANFMQFWTGRGSDGMESLTDAVGGEPGTALRLLKSVCHAGPDSARTMVAAAIATGALDNTHELATTDDWLRFFFPPRRSPLFLLLTYDFTESTVWFERGTWNPTTRSGVPGTMQPYYSVRRVDARIEGSRGLVLDLGTGTMQAMAPDGRRASLHVSRVVTMAGGDGEVSDIGGDGKYSFEWVPNRRFGVLVDRPVAESTFNRLFIRHRPDTRYFRPVTLETPSFQLWEVRGDGL